MSGEEFCKGVAFRAKRLHWPFILVLALCGGVQGQHLVQGVVDGLDDAQVAFTASTLVKQQPGVLVARFDVPTKNIMLRMEPSCAIDQASLNGLLDHLGIRVRCFTRREARDQPFRHLEPMRCGAEQTPER